MQAIAEITRHGETDIKTEFFAADGVTVDATKVSQYI
jgi:hypothetical protein